MCAGEFQLFFRRRAGDDARAHDLADLDRGKPGSAGGAKHDQGFSRLELTALTQAVQRRAVNHRQAGGTIEVECVRQFDKLHCRSGDEFARSPPSGRTHHPVAGSKVGHASADTLDHTGEFRRGREREWRLVLVLAGDDQRVEEIERSSLDAYDCFASFGGGFRDIDQFELVGTAEMRANYRFHGNLVVWNAVRARSRNP